MTQKTLTEQESIVLAHSKTGKSLQEIAKILCISQHTVKALLISAKRKLNIDSLTDLPISK